MEIVEEGLKAVGAHGLFPRQRGSDGGSEHPIPVRGDRCIVEHPSCAAERGQRGWATFGEAGLDGYPPGLQLS